MASNITDFAEEIIEGQHLLCTTMLRNNSAEYQTMYELLRKELRNAFRNYRASSPSERRIMEQLIGSHAKLCIIQKDVAAKRRHNSFVLMYMANEDYSLTQIAQLQGITRRTVGKDIDHVLDDMMLFAFGIDGIKPTGKDA